MSNHALNIFSTASRKTDKAVIISSPCSSQNTLILSSRGFIMSEIFQTISAVFSLIHQKSVARASASAAIHAIINQIGDIKKDNPEEMLETIHGNELITKINHETAVVTKRIFDASSGFLSIQSASLSIIG